MNEPHLNDLFEIDPFASSFRNLLRPWLLDSAKRAPPIKSDLTGHDEACAVKSDIPID